MAVKIYDSSAGAFKDAPTPQIYDVSTQAYKDSTGLVYDQSKEAWDERWDRKILLYDKGIKYTTYLTGFSFGYFDDTGAGWTATEKDDHIELVSQARRTFGCSAAYCNSANKIDLTNFNRLGFDINHYAHKIVSTSREVYVLGCMDKQYSGWNAAYITSSAYNASYVYLGDGNSQDVTKYQMHVSVDISNLVGSYYLAMLSQEDGTLEITKIWLEK